MLRIVIHSPSENRNITLILLWSSTSTVHFVLHHFPPGQPNKFQQEAPKVSKRSDITVDCLLRSRMEHCHSVSEFQSRVLRGTHGSSRVRELKTAALFSNWRACVMKCQSFFKHFYNWKELLFGSFQFILIEFCVFWSRCWSSNRWVHWK